MYIFNCPNTHHPSGRIFVAIWWPAWIFPGHLSHSTGPLPEVKFVHPVSPGGSVKFVSSGVNFSIQLIFCIFPTKTVEIR